MIKKFKEKLFGEYIVNAAISTFYVIMGIFMSIIGNIKKNVLVNADINFSVPHNIKDFIYTLRDVGEFYSAVTAVFRMYVFGYPSVIFGFLSLILSSLAMFLCTKDGTKRTAGYFVLLVLSYIGLVLLTIAFIVIIIVTKKYI